MINKNVNYNIDESELSNFPFVVNEFQSLVKGDFFTTSLHYPLEGQSLHDAEMSIAKDLRSALKCQTRIQHVDNRTFYIQCSIDDTLVALIFGKIYQRSDSYFNDIFDDSARTIINLHVSGGDPHCELAANAIRQPYTSKSSMKWYYLNDGRMDYSIIDVEQKDQMHDEMFPWIESGVTKYFNKYLESNANVLILLGPPGTGKTTFIRELIVRNNLDAMITYEESLMNSDRLFIELMSGRQDILIMEDADILLMSREQEHNAIMSKLLNISDGLLKNKKKIIFTANLGFGAINKTDYALIRPGRCFDVMNFRELTYKEAEKVTNKLNIPMPKEDFNEITLAKLTNPDYQEPTSNFKVGFN